MFPTTVRSTGVSKRTARWLATAMTLAALAVLPPFVGPAAAVTAKDIQVAARSVAFLSNPPTGTVEVAVVFDPGNADSKADADSIKGLITQFPKAGGATLAPVLVPSDQLGQLSGKGVVFMASGVGNAGAVFSAAASDGVPTLSIGEACVRAGHCVVGVVTSPKVQILVNKSAAEAASVSFKSAFLMMIQEV
ncbi:hypothetical protein [Yunchengibacter salinarum]|uniref:hypothetical protein n=1 Tax=Yunchengibacter salinarum TaxID=3133399 RepID=UPI0035B60E1D